MYDTTNCPIVIWRRIVRARCFYYERSQRVCGDGRREVRYKLCYINRMGKWWLLDEWKENLERHGGAQLLAAPGTGIFMKIPGNGIVRIDVILRILHDRHSEDGTVPGLAKLVHVSIVGCDVTACAVCMDKALTKQVLLANGIKTAKCIIYRNGAPLPNYESVAEELGGVLFVKPSRSGSSSAYKC